MNRPMELDIWKGDWGLPSIDLDCLRLVTYCKFSGAPVQINLKTHTLRTINGSLPVFSHYKRTFSTIDAVINYLTSKNLSPDFGLNQKQKADTIAFTMYIKEYLYPAILYVWWVDEKNRVNLIRKWFAKTMPFPLNFFYPDRYQKAAETAIENLFPHIQKGPDLEAEIYNRAGTCLNVISQRLGNQEFMFGAHPSSIDATLFAYLALLIKPPFPNGKFKNQVVNFNNLLKYVTRISQRYYAAETQEFDARRIQDQANETPGQIDNYPHKRRNQILATGFAMIAMAGYAFSTGLLQVDAPFSRSHTVLIHTEYEDN